MMNHASAPAIKCATAAATTKKEAKEAAANQEERARKATTAKVLTVTTAKVTVAVNAPAVKAMDTTNTEKAPVLAASTAATVNTHPRAAA